MLKKIFTYIGVTCVLFGIASNASSTTEVCSSNNRLLTCGAGTVKKLNNIGETSLNGTTVKGILELIGTTEIKSAVLGDVIITGNTHIAQTKINGTFSVAGNFETENSSIAKAAKIIGDVSGNHGEFNGYATIVGRLNISDFNFKSITEIVGEVHATNMLLVDKLIIDTIDSDFSHSTMQTIVVLKQKINSKVSEQRLEFRDKSVINGNIEFLGKKGTVVLSGGSKINGKVIGGTIVQQ